MSVSSSISGGGFGSSGAGVSGLSTADGGTALADNKVVRGDGTTGIQGSAVTIDDTTGTVTLPDAAEIRWSDILIRRLAGPVLQILDLAGTTYKSLRARAFEAHNGTTLVAALDPASTVSGLRLGSGGAVAWESAAAPYAGSADLALLRGAANIAALTNGSTGGAALELTEMTAPSAPAANKGRLYVEDNGAGKSRLVVIFPSGAAQVLATEP